MRKTTAIILLVWLSWPLSIYAGWPLTQEQWEWFPQIHASYTVWFVESVTTVLIYIVAVAAVFGVIFSWILYLISAGEDEKAKKAKNWIIFSLIWVFVSVSAWWIINLLNFIVIGL
jgi:hypothetical protein